MTGDATPPPSLVAMRHHDGLLIDVGGVLTGDIFVSFDAHCARIGLDGVSFRDLYFGSAEAKELLHRLETGAVAVEDVEPRLARMLGIPEERSNDLFAGLYADLEYLPEMTRAVEALREHGVRTGVLSNSWWYPMYDRPFYARAFDVQVVSGRVGVRKPDPAIFERAVRELGVAPERIVFVDDFEENLPPARALGMTTLLHDTYAPQRTVAELERLFDVSGLVVA
jgi:epoxide hydrolase-like predicted phosphatase